MCVCSHVCACVLMYVSVFEYIFAGGCSRVYVYVFQLTICNDTKLDDRIKL